MCGNRSWHTYEMHLVSLRKSGVTIGEGGLQFPIEYTYKDPDIEKDEQCMTLVFQCIHILKSHVTSHHQLELCTFVFHRFVMTNHHQLMQFISVCIYCITYKTCAISTYDLIRVPSHFMRIFTVHNTTQRSYSRIISFSLRVKW
jgi:hypothetical protein